MLYIKEVMVLIGVLVGILIPAYSEKFSAYKYAKKNKKLTENAFFSSKTLKFFVAVVNAFGWYAISYICKSNIVMVIAMVIWTLSIVITIIDLRIHIIPNEILLALIVLGLLYEFFIFGLRGVGQGILMMFLLLFVFMLVSKYVGLWKIGAGDVKLAAVMGLILGNPYVAAGLMGMAVSVLVICLGGIIIKKLTLKSMIPFGPFFSIGIMYGLVNMLLHL